MELNKTLYYNKYIHKKKTENDHKQLIYIIYAPTFPNTFSFFRQVRDNRDKIYNIYFATVKVLQAFTKYATAKYAYAFIAKINIRNVPYGNPYVSI